MIYFLVYNDGTHNDHLTKLIDSVHLYGKECKVVVFHKAQIDPRFLEKNKAIFNYPRGGGYWLWKPYIIYQTLQKLKEGDLLFYLDSKYYFLEPFTPLYEEYMKTNDIMVWKNKPNESTYSMKHWCKMDVIRKYNMMDKVFKENAADCWAGAIVLKKSAFSVTLMKTWLNMCCCEDITDTPSKIRNQEGFREHRHDQSLLSIVLHKYKVNLPFFESKYLQNVRCPFNVK